MIDNEFGNDILTLEDDDGVEHTFEVLDAIDNGENRYMALSPVFDDPQESLDDSGELVILKVVTVDGGNFWKLSKMRTKWTKSLISSWNVWKKIMTLFRTTRNNFLYFCK